MCQIKRTILGIILTLFTIAFNSAYAQNVIRGAVRSSTGEVIPFATVTIKNTKVLTDLNGVYQLTLKSFNKIDTITFSCIGFRSSAIVLSKAIQDPDIILYQANYVLDEVSINIGGNPRIEKWGNTANNFLNKLSSRVNDQYALYIENPAGKPYIIQSINYYIKEPRGGSYEGPFRVRVYSKSKSNGQPDKDLLIDNLIVRAKRKNSWFNVDVSKYQIEMPNDGLFIAMEILPEVSYEIGVTKKTGSNYQNNLKMPCLGLNQSINKNYSWIKNEFWGGNENWRAFDLTSSPANFMMNIEVKL